MTKWNTYQLIKSYSCYKCPLVLLSTYCNSASGNIGPVRPNIDLGDLFCSKSHGCFLYKQPLRFLSGVLFLSHKGTKLSYFFIIGNKPTLGKITYETGYRNICPHQRWQSNIIRHQRDSPKVRPSFFYLSPFILALYPVLLLQFNIAVLPSQGICTHNYSAQAT